MRRTSLEAQAEIAGSAEKSRINNDIGFPGTTSRGVVSARRPSGVTCVRRGAPSAWARRCTERRSRAGPRPLPMAPPRPPPRVRAVPARRGSRPGPGQPRDHRLVRRAHGACGERFGGLLQFLGAGSDELLDQAHGRRLHPWRCDLQDRGGCGLAGDQAAPCSISTRGCPPLSCTWRYASTTPLLLLTMPFLFHQQTSGGTSTPARVGSEARRSR